MLPKRRLSRDPGTVLWTMSEEPIRRGCQESADWSGQMTETSTHTHTHWFSVFILEMTFLMTDWISISICWTLVALGAKLTLKTLEWKPGNFPWVSHVFILYTQLFLSTVGVEVSSLPWHLQLQLLPPTRGSLSDGYPVPPGSVPWVLWRPLLPPQVGNDTALHLFISIKILSQYILKP